MKIYLQISNGKATATTTQTEKSIASVDISFFRNPQRVSAKEDIDAELDQFNNNAHVTSEALLMHLNNRERNNDKINQDPYTQQSSVARYENVTEI